MLDLGCSSFTWTTEDNKHLLGRTYDQFGNLDGNRIVYVPKNKELALDNVEKENNIFETKNSFVGMAIVGLKTPILVDGINDKGVTGALLHYPNFAYYDKNKNEDMKDINPGFFVSYMLGVCSSIDEIIEAVKKINLTNTLVFNKPIPVHYIFSDKTGKSIIVEPDETGLSIHENTIGVMTNSPGYLWHKQNLNNYKWVTNEARGPQVICGETFDEYEFTGLVLPGDYASPSRFIRVALMKNFAPTPKDELDGVTRMFHIFSTVDIPEGMKTIKIPEGPYAGNYYEKTLCMSVVCSESLMYYYTLATNRRICAIDLNKLEGENEIKYFDLEEKQDILYIN